MSYENNCITFIGNVTADPDLRFTQSGAPVCSLRVAHNRKTKGKDDETTFLGVTCWGDLGERVADEISKGDRVVVIGRIQIRSYEKKDGTTAWSTDIVADECSPSLRFAKKGGGSAPAAADDDGEIPF